MIRRWEVRSTTKRIGYKIPPRFFFHTTALRYASYLNVMTAIEGFPESYYVVDRKKDE